MLKFKSEKSFEKFIIAVGILAFVGMVYFLLFTSNFDMVYYIGGVCGITLSIFGYFNRNNYPTTGLNYLKNRKGIVFFSALCFIGGVMFTLFPIVV